MNSYQFDRLSDDEKAKVRAAELAFLDETCKHFNSKNRANNSITGGNCVYSHKTNGGCAIGRKMTAENAEKADGCSGTKLCDVIGELTEDILPVELRAMRVEILGEIQNLHDCCGYWNETGLSKSGQERKKMIEEEINQSETPL